MPSSSPLFKLLAVLAVCLCLVAVVLTVRSLDSLGLLGPGAATDPQAASPGPGGPPSAAPAPAPTDYPSAVPTPTPEPTPSPETSASATPETPQVKIDGDAPVQGEGAPGTEEAATPTDSGEWFSDAVFIGDSRVGGLRLYSGVTTEATFLDHTGLTIYEVKDEEKVIRRGDQKVSVLDALAAGSYGKVYLALGVNELGYYDPEGFAQTCGEVVDAIRELLPDARIYLQSLIPVNTEKCKANEIPYYVTNEGIANYNTALENYFADKDVYLLGTPDGLLDETGEVLREYSADGVHFKREGYVLWLNYLAAHPEG